MRDDVYVYVAKYSNTANHIYVHANVLTLVGAFGIRPTMKSGSQYMAGATRCNSALSGTTRPRRYTTLSQQHARKGPLGTGRYAAHRSCTARSRPRQPSNHAPSRVSSHEGMESFRLTSKTVAADREEVTTKEDSDQAG